MVVCCGVHRIVLKPTPRRAGILQDLHVTHPGVSHMKALAHSNMYWEGIDKNIERFISDCATGQEHLNVPQSTELHPWEWANKPWSHLHTAFAGLFICSSF